ncbi:MAG: hypothetical protein AB7Q37_11580 [Pyrinomonadaceae bacterium]
MKVLVSLFLLAIAFSILSCSKAVEETNPAANSGPVQISENESPTPVSNQSPVGVESKSPLKPRDRVVVEGRDYIKKSGWTIPSGAVKDITERQTDKGITKDGKELEVILIFYDYEAPKSYSENFYYDGPNLEYMKGRLRSGGFTEYSVNSRVFMYAVFAKKLAPPPASNSDPHEDPFVYTIKDADGDGIFETLLGDYDKILVPDWVLK